MKAYLASWFASKEDMVKRAEELRAHGIEVTSRWLEEKVAGTTQIHEVSPAYLQETALVDIEDILQADTVVLNTPTEEDLKRTDMPIATWARGGRHFEAGFHYATMMFYWSLSDNIRNRGYRKLILVGHKENVFHYLDDFTVNGLVDGYVLPTIQTYSTWNEAKEAIFLAAGVEKHSAATIG